MGTPLKSSGLVGFVGFIGARPGVSLGSFGRALGVVGFILARVRFIRIRVAHLGTPLRLSGLVGFVEFIGARPGVSLGSFGRALGVVGFISARALGFIRARHGCRWVHSGAGLGSSGSFVFRARPGGPQVQLGWLGSFGHALGFC